MDGPEAVRDALAQHTTDFARRRQLHDIRPHVVYEVTFGGRRAVCKVDAHPEGSAGVEGRVMARVGDETSVPVPEVLAAGDDHVVTGWADEVPQAADELTRDEARVRAMGRGLARLHEESAAEFDGTGLLEIEANTFRVATDDRWSDTLLALLARRRAFLADFGYADVARDVETFVRDNRATFDAVDDAVLVHGNWLPDAVGIRREGDGRAEVARVIDWEHALVGSPEWDYLRVAGPMFAGATPDGQTATEADFREAYESVRPLPEGFDRRRDALAVVNGLSYLRSLLLQRADRDPLPEVARRAYRLRQHLRDRLAELEESTAADQTSEDTAG